MKGKVIFICIAVVLLIAAFFLGGTGETIQSETETTTALTTEVATELTTQVTTSVSATDTTETAAEGTSAEPTTLMQTTMREAAALTETTIEPTTAASVYLSVDYKVLLGSYDRAEENNGIVYAGTHTYYEGQTAFDLLRDAMQAAGIPMEFSQTPAYDSIYIEGIDNVYEFDFGELSGWSYRVNGVFPGYSSSQYTLSPGDRVEFLYTCDLGRDVGNTFGNSDE